jgi:hypothetical protein
MSQSLRQAIRTAGGLVLETIMLRRSAAVELDLENASPRPLFLSARAAGGCPG